MKHILATFLTLSILSLTAAAESKRGWDDNYAQALSEAKQENKDVLLNFTGSDWCIFCIKLDQNVFSKADFQRLAKASLKLVELDFPQDKALSREVQQQNDRLQSQFNVQGFPTLILVDPQGREQARWEGYNPDLVDDLKQKLEKR
ncbi:MAG: thioredoxin family protein [Prosthecobacter sp.]